MKRMFNFRNLAILCLAFGLVVSLTRCKKYDDDVNSLQTQINALKADMEKDFKEKVDSQIVLLKDQVTKAEAKITALEKSSVKGPDVDAKIANLKTEIMNTKVSQVAFEQFKQDVLAKIKAAGKPADLTKIETDINSLDGRIAVIEALLKIQKGKSDIFKDLAAKITANETELETLKKDLANKANQSDFAALKTRVDNFLAKNLDVSIAALSGRLSSLVLIPDYVADDAGALPVLNFSPIRTKTCGDIVPKVEVKYMVNPSNAKEDQIDKTKLMFVYNDPISLKLKKAGNEVDQKAEFVSLVDGVLTVKVSVNTVKLWASKGLKPKGNPENRIDQLMLQVPLKDGNVISSDWARAAFTPKTIAIVKKPKKQPTDHWKLYELKPYVFTNGTTVKGYSAPITGQAPSVDKSVADGVIVGDPTKDYTVVDMVYDENLDLMKHVQAMFRNFREDIPLDVYGLHFDFDLKNGVTGKDIVYKLGKNDTDQQEFIELSGMKNSIVSTRVYKKGGNRASIGRTPIVHVMLKKNDGGCVAREGYIKLNIIDKIIPPVIYQSPSALQAKCGTQEANRIGTQKMNEDFYHVVNMTKEEFHKNYVFAQVPLLGATVDPTNVGTISQVTDPGDKQSYNLVYTLTEDQVWANIGKTVWAKATYTFGTSVIEITFKTKITKETVNLKLVIGNFWYDGDARTKSLTTGKYNAVVSNVAIPAAGATNPALCTWDNNINDVFKTGANKLLDLKAQGYKNYTYRYEFDTNQEKIKNKFKPIKFIVESSDVATGKVNDLLYGEKGGVKELIAKIKPAVANVGNNIEYQQTDLAKWLLNEGPESMRAEVVLVVLNTPCKKPVNVVINQVEEKDRFDVIFVRPVNVEKGSSTPFYDNVGAGNPGSYIDMKKVALLSDWRDYIADTDEYWFSKYPNFYDYYDVVNIKADIANIKTKNLAGVSPKMPSTLNIAQTANGEVFGTETYRFGRLTYDNNGHNFNTGFTLIVPVTVSYKWGDVKTMIEIEVNSTGTPKP